MKDFENLFFTNGNLSEAISLERESTVSEIENRRGQLEGSRGSNLKERKKERKKKLGRFIYK